jgi:hypothetical protein
MDLDCGADHILDQAFALWNVVSMRLFFYELLYHRFVVDTTLFYVLFMNCRRNAHSVDKPDRAIGRHAEDSRFS